MFAPTLAAVLGTVLVSGCSGKPARSATSASAPSAAPSQGPSVGATTRGATTAAGSGPANTMPTPAPTGPANLAAQRIFAASKKSTAAIKSMRITGTQTGNGQTIKLDLRFGEHSSSGRITQGGYTFDLIFVGPKFYFRAPVSFINAQFKNKVPAAVKKAEGKYIESAASSTDARPYKSFASREPLLNGVFYAHPNLARGPNRKVDGVLCASLVDPGRGTFYVRLDDNLPVQVNASTTGGGVLNFSQFNRVPDPEAPPAGQAVDAKGNPAS